MTEALSSHIGLSPTPSCGREGCSRRKGRDGYCSLLCSEMDRRLTKTRALIAEKGISPTAAELWAAVVSLSDQLTEVQRLERILTSSTVASWPTSGDSWAAGDSRGHGAAPGPSR